MIVDDEAPARQLLRSMLAAWPDVSVVGEAADGKSAVAVIGRERPDLAFLDIQMPDLTGFEVIGAIPPETVPLVVFVTAYDRYAVKAFEVNALDYLLKPFDEDRLATTMTRLLARREPRGPELHAAVTSLLARLHPGPSQVVFKVDGRHLFLAADEVEWIESEGKTLRVHAGKQTLVVRESMNSLEGRLGPGRFLRVHRSHIVNRSHIREIQPWFRGESVLILRGGGRVLTGRTYREAVQQLLDSRGTGPGWAGRR